MDRRGGGQPRAAAGLDLLELLLRLQPAAARDRARPRPAPLRPAGRALRERRHLHGRWRLLRLLWRARRPAARDAPVLHRDADNYERYVQAVMRQCRFIRPLLLRTPPDPVALRPRDVGELLFLGRRFHDLGQREMGEAIRFWTMSIGDFLDQYFETPVIKAHLAGSGIIGTGPGRLLAGHRLRAAAPLYGRRGRCDRRLGLRPRRHGCGQPRAGRSVRGRGRRDPGRLPASSASSSATTSSPAWRWRTATSSRRRSSSPTSTSSAPSCAT